MPHEYHKSTAIDKNGDGTPKTITESGKLKCDADTAIVYLRIIGGKLIIRSIWDTTNTNKALNNKDALHVVDVKVTDTLKSSNNTFHVASGIAEIGAADLYDKVYNQVPNGKVFEATAYIPYGYAVDKVLYTAQKVGSLTTKPTYWDGTNLVPYNDNDYIIIITVTTEMLPFYRDCSDAPAPTETYPRSTTGGGGNP
jgi:hypothetical protein